MPKNQLNKNKHKTRYPDLDIRNLKRTQEEYRKNKEELVKIRIKQKAKLCCYIIAMLILVTILSISFILLQRENISAIAKIRNELTPINQMQPVLQMPKSKAEDSEKIVKLVKVSACVLNDKKLQSSFLELNKLKGPWEPFSPTNHAMFLQFLKTGGMSTMDILGICHRKVLASVGIKGHANDKKFTIVKGYGNFDFVNISPTTPEGIDFADNSVADPAVTLPLHAINSLLKPDSQGRVFSMFQHPIECTSSMLNYMKILNLFQAIATNLKP